MTSLDRCSNNIKENNEIGIILVEEGYEGEFGNQPFYSFVSESNTYSINDENLKSLL